MTDDELELIINKITEGKYTEAELSQLLLAFKNKDNEQISLQLAKFNVNIGKGKDIHIGDKIYYQWNEEAVKSLIEVVEGNKEAIKNIFNSRKKNALLTYQEYSERAEKNITITHKAQLIGRENILTEIKELITKNTDIIVVYGAGGVGKTRLLLELPTILCENIKLWFTCDTAESIESELTQLDNEKEHIIVVDDAHNYDLLPKLREVLINPQLSKKVRLILATRTPFRDSLIDKFGILRNHQIEKIDIPFLNNEDIDKILQNPPYEIVDTYTRHRLVVIAEKNPLIATIAVDLMKKGESLLNLNKNNIVTNYLNYTINELKNIDNPDDALKVKGYLRILAALKTINLEDKRLTNKINELINISQIDQPRIVNLLVNSGLVQKYWQTLKISSEFLADHILIQDFFNPETKQADYQTQIFEPFFQFKPKDICNYLRQVN